LIAVHSCGHDEDDSNVTFNGTVSYRETNLVAPNVPLQLVIFDLDMSIRNPAFTVAGQTNSDGTYLFSLAKRDLPRNVAYRIRTGTDSLLLFPRDNLVVPCVAGIINMGSVAIPGVMSYQWVDPSTYFQITFQKISPGTDRVKFDFCRIVHETGPGTPNITVTNKLPFYYFKKIDLKYQIVKESGEMLDYRINAIQLIKNDTTKIVVEY